MGELLAGIEAHPVTAPGAEPDAPAAREDARQASASVRVPKAAELIAAQLRREILRGDRPEGEPLLPESQLTQRFGVSRPTLREAFRILESESLISVRRGARGGARVRQPSDRVAALQFAHLLQAKKVTVGDVYRAQTILEPPVIRLVAEKPTKRAAAAIRDSLRAEHDAIDDPAAHSTASNNFHQTVIELGGNATITSFHLMLREIMQAHIGPAARACRERRERDGDRPELRAYRTHERLAELITGGSATEAEVLWRHHLEAAGQILLREIGSLTVIDVLG